MTSSPPLSRWFCRCCGTLDVAEQHLLRPHLCWACVRALNAGQRPPRQASPWLLRQRRIRARAIALGLPVVSVEAAEAAEA